MTSSGVPVSGVVALRERERYVAVLRGSTTEAEWRQLGSVDIDSAMCDLFSWLGDRGLCSACVDAVTAALLEVRRAVTGNCTCSRCLGLCGGRKALGASADGAGDSPTPTTAIRVAGGPPELLRVQGQLRAICGVYRLEALPFNGRPVYKKERAEAYLLYTSLKDWMVSGRADAGGSRCEGWAYVTDPAETPDEVCGVWKISGPRGWEEDTSLCVTVFEGLPEDMRQGLGYDDGSSIARRLAADDRGVLLVPLQEPEVLEEVLWAPDEAPPTSTRSGACTHVTTAESAQRELRCWLRWLLRDRLDAQRRRVLAQAQVGASLCRLFACAALQQLEQAAEEPPATPRRREKKGRGSKKGRLAVMDDANDDTASLPESVDTPAREPSGRADAAPRASRGEPAIACASASACTGAAAAVSTVEVADSRAVAEETDGRGVPALASPGSQSTRASKKSPAAGCGHVDSDESASTRASSEEPPDAHRAELAMGARRLMEQMGWRPEATNKAETLGSTEVALWREQHPCYRQVVHEERQKLKTQFLKWARATLR